MQDKIKERRRELSKDEIISSFRDKMRDLRKDKDIALSMEETLDTWKGDIMKMFKKVFDDKGSGNVRMTHEDIELAPYFFSGMNSKTISYLTGYTEPSLRVRKTRIKHRIQELGEPFENEKNLFLENL